jgi:hypothetical protein
MLLRIGIVIISLACIFAGVGWLTTGGNLEAAQTAGESLKTGNGQFELANTSDNTSIVGLEQGLADSEEFSAYRWESAYPAEFASVDELKAWLAQDDTDSTLYIYGSGCILEYDCDDYAIALVRNALADGYSVSLQIEGEHMLNSTIIGNEIYFIEPQSDKVWLWGYRD